MPRRSGQPLRLGFARRAAPWMARAAPVPHPLFPGRSAPEGSRLRAPRLGTSGLLSSASTECARSGGFHLGGRDSPQREPVPSRAVRDEPAVRRAVPAGWTLRRSGGPLPRAPHGLRDGPCPAWPGPPRAEVPGSAASARASAVRRRSCSGVLARTPFAFNAGTETRMQRKSDSAFSCWITAVFLPRESMCPLSSLKVAVSPRSPG